MGFSDWVDVEFEYVVAETDKALLFILNGGEKKWIPLSVISDPDDYKKGQRNGTVSVKEWFAEKELDV